MNDNRIRIARNARKARMIDIRHADRKTYILEWLLSLKRPCMKARFASISTVAVKMLDTPHKQTNKKQPILRLLISFWFQNNRLEISFSEHIEPFHSYEYEQSYAIFSDWNDLKFLTILRFISECVVTGFPQQKKRF